MYTKKSERWDGRFYRQIMGVPIDAMGNGYCPRCDAGERDQMERGTVVQSELDIGFGTLTAYMRCYECGLEYTYIEEGVLL